MGHMWGQSTSCKWFLFCHGFRPTNLFLVFFIIICSEPTITWWSATNAHAPTACFQDWSQTSNKKESCGFYSRTLFYFIYLWVHQSRKCKNEQKDGIPWSRHPYAPVSTTSFTLIVFTLHKAPGFACSVSRLDLSPSRYQPWRPFFRVGSTIDSVIAIDEWSTWTWRSSDTRQTDPHDLCPHSGDRKARLFPTKNTRKFAGYLYLTMGNVNNIMVYIYV